MTALQKFKILATHCAVAASPSRSPTGSSPVIHLRRRKTLQMLLHRGTSSPDGQDIEDEDREKKAKEFRVRRKLKDLLVSSPPIDDRAKEERLLVGTGNGNDGSARRRRGGRSLRPLSAAFRYRLMRRAWRPMLFTIPE